MSSKKLPLQKGYISSSSQQQQHRKAYRVIPSNHSVRLNSSKGHSQNVQYSLLDKMSLRGDLVKGESGSEEEDQLRILDQEEQSHDQGSEQYSQQQDIQQQQQQYSQHHHQPSTPTSSSGTVQTLDPLQKKRLQILQKLQQQDICSPQQYQSIIGKLQQQNQKLQLDLQTLKQKVDLLKLKQMRKNKEKIKTESQNKRYPEEEYKKMKGQLKKRYKELKRLQKKSTKSSTSLGLEIQYREFINKLIQLQGNCQIMRASRKDEKKIHQNLRNQLKKYTTIGMSNSPQAQQLEIYNKQLKNKLFLIKKLIASQQQSQLQIHKFNIQMKERQKKIAEIIRIQELKSKERQKKQLMRGTILATVGGGEIQKIETKDGVVKLFKVDSKVRARTEFSFQDGGRVDQKVLEKPLLVGRNHSALTQVANDTPMSGKKLSIRSSNKSITPKNILPPVIPFSPLPSHQINTVAQSLQTQTITLHHLSQSIQKRLTFLQEQLNPHYKRQGSLHIFSKEKDMLVMKNRLLIEELKAVYGKKVELMREYNIVERYYGRADEGEENENGERRGKYNSTEMIRRERQENSNTLPRISQINEFNRSRSEMKFAKINSDQGTQIFRRSILSAEKSLKNYKAQSNVKKSPSMPTYNNGHSQSLESKKQKKEDFQQLQKQKQRLKQEKEKKVAVECKQIETQVQLNFSCFIHSNNNSKNQLQQKVSKPTNTAKQDFIGQIQLQECHFDDRIYSTLNNNSHMYINELTVHHTHQGVIFVQAKYKPETNSLPQLSDQNPLTTELSFKVPTDIRQSTLSTPYIITSSTELSVNDYIKQIKVMYNMDQGYVARLQVVSKFNVKYDFGNKGISFPTAFAPHLNINIEKEKDIEKEMKKRNRSRNQDDGRKIIEDKKKTQNNHKYYAFDIKPNQYPSFMFGNFKFTQEGKLMLSGLGFVIHNQPK